VIVFCELSFPDAAHVPFNAGLLATVRAAFPQEDLSFFGAAAHIEELKTQVGQPLAATISWQEVFPPVPGTPYLQRFFRELKIISRLLRSLSQDSSGQLICTSAYPSTVLALKSARCLRSSRIPVQMVLHGLSGVVGQRYRRPVRRFQDMKTALTILGNKKIQYLVLEQSIRDTVLKGLPCLSGRVEALDHPLPPNEAESVINDLSPPISFGFLGLANEPKGFPTFVKLANEIVAKFGHGAEFHAIGRLPADATPPNGMDSLATKPGVTRMNRADFIRGVRQLHFIVLLHQAAPYALSASGTLLDAIAWEKPVIARSTPIFKSMFEKHGDIGYLFRDDAELRLIVEYILQKGDQSRYQRQVLNLRNTRHSRTPATLAASYREICRKQEGDGLQPYFS
jgi:hypothetical protein